jgi:hypothetical protein
VIVKVKVYEVGYVIVITEKFYLGQKQKAGQQVQQRRDYQDGVSNRIYILLKRSSEGEEIHPVRPVAPAPRSTLQHSLVGKVART